MQKSLSFFLAILFTLSLQCCNHMKQGKEHATLVLMQTTMGDIKIKLYDETPLHRDNFIKLVNQGFYDSVLFHRVIKDFMIQTGDPDSKSARSGQQLGNGGPGYTIPAEIRPSLYHKKGAVAAARMSDQVNPEKASSGSQFYIVVGTKYSDDDLNQMENRVNDMNQQSIFYLFYKNLREKAAAESKDINPAELQQQAIQLTRDSLQHCPVFSFPTAHREVYKTIGGTPFLDNNYTVFGEVVEGLDVVDKIAAVSTDQADRPLQDVRIIKMKVVKK